MVPVSCIRQHHHDKLVSILFPRGGFYRRRSRRPAGNARRNSFLFVQPTGHFDRFVAADSDDLIHQAQIENFRNEAGADSLNFVRSRLWSLSLFCRSDYG